MSTHLWIVCPRCGRGLNVRPDYVGKTVACRFCDQIFLIVASDDLATLDAAEFDRLRVERDEIGDERDRLREQVEGFESRRQADALLHRRLTEEIDAHRLGREQLEAERQAAWDEAKRLRAALDELVRSLRDAQLGHDAACAALTREHEESRGRWELERGEIEARTERQRADQAREREAAAQLVKEQVDTLMAELDGRRRAFDAAGRSHEQSLAALRQGWAAEREQGEERLASLRAQFAGDREALLGEIEALREGCEAARRERDLAAALVESLERECARRAVADEEHGRRLRDLESALAGSVEAAGQARDEARRAQEDLLQLRSALVVSVEAAGQARGEARRAQEDLVQLRSALVASGEATDSARDEARRAQEDLLQLRSAFAASVEAASQARDEARRAQEDVAQLRSALAASGEAASQARDEARRAQEDVAQLRSALVASGEVADRARDEAQRAQEDVAQLGEMLEQAQGRERAAAGQNGTLQEQLVAERAESERRRQGYEAGHREFQRRLAGGREERDARRREWQDELAQARSRFLHELQELREENDRRRAEADLLRQERDLAQSEVEAMLQNRESLAQSLDALEAAHEGAERRFRAEIARLAAELAEAERRRESNAGRSDALSGEVVALRAELDRERMARRPSPDDEWADPRRVGRPSTALSACGRLPMVEESPAVALAFPSEEDLSLVRGQVEVLNGLLRPGQSSGRVLIYQQRLAEFSQKLREASRLATTLVNEVEQARRRDEVQFHMYLVRRAEEIEKTRV